MKTVVLKDGTAVQALDDSNVMQIRIPAESFAEADAIKAHFTRENMETVRIGAEEFHEVIPTAVSATEADGSIVITFYNQDGLQDYVRNQIDNYTLRLIEEEVI